MATPPPKSQGPSTGARVASVVLVLVGAALWLGLLFGIGIAGPRFMEIFEKFKIGGNLSLPTRIAGGAGLVVRDYWFLFGLLWLVATIALARKAASVASNVFDRWPTTFALISFLCVCLIFAFVMISLFVPLAHNIEVFGH